MVPGAGLAGAFVVMLMLNELPLKKLILSPTFSMKALSLGASSKDTERLLLQAVGHLDGRHQVRLHEDQRTLVQTSKVIDRDFFPIGSQNPLSVIDLLNHVTICIDSLSEDVENEPLGLDVRPKRDFGFRHMDSKLLGHQSTMRRGSRLYRSSKLRLT